MTNPIPAGVRENLNAEDYRSFLARARQAAKIFKDSYSRFKIKNAA